MKLDVIMLQFLLKKTPNITFKNILAIIILSKLSFFTLIFSNFITIVSAQNTSPTNTDLDPVSASFEIARSVEDTKQFVELINNNQATSFDWQNSVLAKVDINILKPGWKVYYRYPGFIGYEPRFSLVDKNLNQIDDVDLKILWPIPERGNVFGIEVFAYLQNIQIPLIIQNTSKLNINSDRLLVEIYTCLDVCIKKDFLFKLNEPAKFENTEFLSALNYVPIIGRDFLDDISYDPELFEVSIKLNQDYDYKDILITNKKNIFRIKDTNQSLPHLDQVMVRDADLNLGLSNTNILSAKSQLATKQNELIVILDRADKPPLMQEIVVNSDAALNLKASFKSINPQSNTIDSKPIYTKNSQAINQQKSLLFVLLLAFIGGLILNFMPCVLPVISMKLLFLVDVGSSSSSKKQIRIQKISLLANWFGVMMAFFTMAVSLALLKFFGNTVGFGIQFQNNYFLIFMIIVLNVFVLNFFNLITFQLPIRINSMINQKLTQTRSKYLEQFFLGFFAVLIATPCSAPFLVTALGYALSENYISLVLIFMMLGLGFSSPYILLLLFPNLIKFLPKSGVWQSHLKKIMACLLILTIAYFIWILSRQQTLIFITFIISSLIIYDLLVLFLKSYRKYSFHILVAVLLVILVILPYSSSRDKNSDKFDLVLIEEEINKGSGVLVNVTADWCLTCKVNEARVLSTSDIKEYFTENDINLITLDWTLSDEYIGAFLARYNNFSIPFYLYYKKNTGQMSAKEIRKGKEVIDEGYILPVLLSKRSLIAEIEGIE